MATVEQEPRAHLAAYVPWGTFLNFIDRLKKSGIPGRIDKSVMGYLAGGTQSHLTSSLKFLGLINATGEPQDALEQLVSAYDTTGFPDALGALVKEAYDDVVGELDITNASPAQLAECFKGAGTTKGQGGSLLLVRIEGCQDRPFLASGKSKAEGRASV